MQAWLLTETNPINPIGIFLNGDAAQAGAVNGRYLVIPIEVGETYTTLCDENLPGAIYFDREGYQQAVQAVKNALADIRSDINGIATRIDNLQTTVTNQLNGIKDDIAALDVRVTALEGN